MHIILKNGLPVLVGAEEGLKLMSCEIRFPSHPVTKQMMGPGDARIHYKTASGDEHLEVVPFKVEA